MCLHFFTRADEEQVAAAGEDAPVEQLDAAQGIAQRPQEGVAAFAEQAEAADVQPAFVQGFATLLSVRFADFAGDAAAGSRGVYPHVEPVPHESLVAVVVEVAAGYRFRSVIGGKDQYLRHGR